MYISREVGRVLAGAPRLLVLLRLPAYLTNRE